MASAWVSASKPALGGGIGFGVGLRHQRAGRGDGDDRALGGAQAAAAAARASRKVAVRLVSITRCQSSSVSRRIGRRIMMPALETTASSRPNRSSVDAHRIAHTVVSSATSPSMVADERAQPRKCCVSRVFGRSSAATHQPASSRWQRDGAADAVGGAGDERDRPVGSLRASLAPSASLWSRPAGPAGRPIRSRSRRRAPSAACRWRRARTTASPR